jgi:hypothetical protein
MIAILDYGVGNLRSVYKAFETVAGPLGIPVDIVDRPTDLLRWRAVVLPGQGAFGDSVDNLRRQGWSGPCSTPWRPGCRCWASAWECSCSSTPARRWASTRDCT